MVPIRVKPIYKGKNCSIRLEALNKPILPVSNAKTPMARTTFFVLSIDFMSFFDFDEDILIEETEVTTLEELEESSEEAQEEEGSRRGASTGTGRARSRPAG